MMRDFQEQKTRLLVSEEGIWGAFAWHCTIADVPSAQSAEWSQLLSFVNTEERTKILKFRYDDDRKRALVSILLQKALIRHYLGHSTDEGFVIRRTPENKPYMLIKNITDETAKPPGLWNYNLSHHGQFVGIASHARLLVGVDIVDIGTRSPSINNSRAYVEMFERNLDPKELSFILSHSSDESIYTAFFVIWSLKESFIKAIGLGLGFELHNICFSVEYDRSDKLCGSAKAVILNMDRDDWEFQFFSLDCRHIMTVAMGPIDDSIDSYKKCALLDMSAAMTEDGYPNKNHLLQCSSLKSSLHRTFFSLLTENQMELYRKLSHEVVEVCNPSPDHGKREILLESTYYEYGIEEDDILITGTPLPRTPLTLPRTPAILQPHGHLKPENTLQSGIVAKPKPCCNNCCIVA